MDMLAYIFLRHNHLEILANTFNILARKNQFIQQTSRKNAPARRIATARNTISDFTESFTENPFYYRHSNLRQVGLIRGDQSIEDLNNSDNCCLYVTTVKTMIFQDNMFFFFFDDIKDHYPLVFDFTSGQYDTDNCHDKELIEDSLSLELKFTLIAR